MNHTAVASRCQGPICVAGQSDRPRPGHERCPRRTSVSSTLQPFRHQSRKVDAERIRIGERLVSVGSTRRQQFGSGRCALRWDRPMSLTSNAQPAPDRHTDAGGTGRCDLRVERRDTNSPRWFGPTRARSAQQHTHCPQQFSSPLPAGAVERRGRVHVELRPVPVLGAYTCAAPPSTNNSIPVM